MLRVGLREHHQLDIGRIALDAAKVLGEIIDFVGREREPERTIGFGKGGAAVGTQLDRPERPRGEVPEQPRRIGERYPAVCTPVLNESRRRPVVSLMGNSGVSSSTGGSCSTTLNGASVPRAAGSSAQRRECRNCSPGCCSS